MKIDINAELGDAYLTDVERLVTERVSEMVVERIADHIMERIMDHLSQRLDQMALDALNDVLATAVQRTDDWGEPIEAPITLQMVVRNQCKDYLAQRMDLYHGKPLVRGQRPSFDEATRAEYLIRKVATDGLDKIALAEMRKLNEQAKTAIGKIVADRFLIEFKKVLPS